MDNQKTIELKLAIEEIANLYAKMDTVKENIKEDINAISEKFDLAKKDVRKTAVAFYKQSFDDEMSDMESFSTLYENLFKGKAENSNV